MTTGQKIYECRRAARMTQEQLAERLGVTRQAVSRWEQDDSFPETRQIMELCRIFCLSADELLFGSEEGCKNQPPDDGKGRTWGVIDHHGSTHFEYISRRRVLGMPLLHVNFGLGRDAVRARGFFSIGIVAVGFFSLGVVSVGLVALGVAALGLLACGSIVLAGAGCGGIVVALAAFGGIAAGFFAVGGLAIGQLAAGGIAVGQFAVGDWAYGYLAVGISRADGAHVFLVADGIGQLAEAVAPYAPDWISRFLAGVASILA